FIDLDQFNVINDTCGHVGGDQLLKRVADLLREMLGLGDIAARLSGDDFCVLLREVTLDEAEAVAKDIGLRLRALRFTWEGRTHQITASIGVAEAAPGMDTAQAMSAADIACYDAKEAGRDTVRVHRAGAASEARLKDMGMVSTIQRALDQGSFVLHRQRIQGLHARNRDDVHYELLLRMIDGDGKLLAPGQFLPAAERYNLMRPIDRWVVEAALPALARLVRSGGDSRPPLYTINLSGASLSDAGFARFLEAQLKAHAFPPQLLCFEITETMAISNLAGAAELMHAVRAAGCRFALDDFGMGMSSFAYLRHLPVDYVKIDGAFIRNILSERIDHHIVDAMARVCGALDIKTVAEFVEEEAMMPVLAELGVDYAQGYAVGRPEALPQGEP
ncbi:MAG: EAL domain-containing protein, partial [Betaproteobacteria bacterium]|nr:EAL domain-containing protein [Betaproteobacteria bacterium]